MMTGYVVVLSLLPLLLLGEALAACDCGHLKVVSKDNRTNRRQQISLGSYNRLEGVGWEGREVWRHKNGKFYLYYSHNSSYWAISQTIGGEVVRLENSDVEGSVRCPNTVKASWRFADGASGGLVPDLTMRAVCPGDGCQGEGCGYNAHCEPSLGHCVCDGGYEGDPGFRCYSRIGSLCNCQEIELLSSNLGALQNQGASYGRYYLQGSSGGHPVYQHETGLLFLYHQDGSWLVSNEVGSRSGGIQNQGDPSMCPYRFKTAWEYADINRPGWQWSYDYNTSMVCRLDGCSVTKCGQRATCTDLGGEGSCSCDIGFDGNPFTRCFPKETPPDCPCTQLNVASRGEAAKTQSDKMGRYYLFGYYVQNAVYQHESGLEYLFHAHGQAWAIGASVGGLRVGVINFSNSSCPYKVGTFWKHSTRGKLDDDPGLSLTCEESSIVQNPFEVEFETSRPFEKISSIERKVSDTRQAVSFVTSSPPTRSGMLQNSWFEQEKATINAILALEDLQNNLEDQIQQEKQSPSTTQLEKVENHHSESFNYATESLITSVTEASFEGIQTIPTGSKGIIHSTHLPEERPTKISDLKTKNEESNIPETFFDRLPSNEISSSSDLSDHDQVSGESIRLYIFSTPDPTNSNQLQETVKPKNYKSHYRSPRTPQPKLKKQHTNIMKYPKKQVKNDTKHSENRKSFKPHKDNQDLHPAYTSLPIKDTQLASKTMGQSFVNQNAKQGHSNHLIKSLSDNSGSLTKIMSSACNCSNIIITSNNPTTINKHAKELGQYTLVAELGGRPVYKHVSRNYFLYYQSDSGGNWLVNNQPGLLYGGLQNSKDFPVCPYLLPTVWQYGDSEVGGWVYDTSLAVTCPASPCSLIKCGFRAQCQMAGEQAACVCREGFSGDPYQRCYPKIRNRCNCRQLKISSVGNGRTHQRDKMGPYYLWGYYNNRPVYQHYSGLDFLYFHKNSVWGVGPKVGGKRAGLLNFSSSSCPYEVTSPWQFGTKTPEGGRQLDTHLSVKCDNK